LLSINFKISIEMTNIYCKRFEALELCTKYYTKIGACPYNGKWKFNIVLNII
jgi:hypothetical protein